MSQIRQQPPARAERNRQAPPNPQAAVVSRREKDFLAACGNRRVARCPPSEGPLTEESDDDENEDDHQENMNQFPGLRDSGDAARSEIAQQPEDQQNDNDDFQQIALLVTASFACNLGACC